MTEHEVHENDPNLDEMTPAEEASYLLGQRLGEDRGLVDVVRFGDAMTDWVKTSIGQYFVHRAERELNEATRALFDCDDLTTVRARTSHHQAQTAIHILRWLDEAVTAGVEAERAIVERDQTA